MIKAGITTMLSALVLHTGVLAQIYVKNPGNVGIGYANPSVKLQVDGNTEITDRTTHDPTQYGTLQLIRPADQGDDMYHLSFIRQGNSVSGMGYARNANVFGIWAFTNSNQPAPTLSFVPGGNVGIGISNPDFKLQIAGNTEISDQGAHDPTKYGVLQLTRPANNGGNSYHLAFVRNGNAVSGIGYAPNSNLFGIWVNAAGGPTDPPAIGCTGGRIGIYTTNPARTLEVAGEVLATEYYATNGNKWPDYVFDSTYNLPVLGEVAAYIKQNHHLPDVPSAEDVKKDGVKLSATQAILLKKVEELTLYTIDLNEKLQLLLEENKKQQAEIENLKKKKGRR